MPSRLSSLLVRDGLVGVKRMERAFQRQVIYGGSLDTILLEMGLVAEERLVQYLSLATGLPPAAREETDVFDADAVKTCPEAVARTYRVAPLCVRDGALRVIVRDPVDLGQLEDLADEIDMPVQPLVVPEYRFNVVFARVFGRETDARFATLAKAAAEAPPTPPVGKARTVIVEGTSGGEDEGGEDHVVVDVALPPSASAKTIETNKARTKTMAFSTDALAKHLDETETKRKQAEARRRPTADDVAPQATPTATPSAPTSPMPAADTPLPAPVAAAPPPRPALSVDDIAPLPLAEARTALAQADDRDMIFSLLLRAVRSRVWYAGLLTIQGRAAIGRVAIAGDGIDRESVAQVLIPVDEARAFNQTVSSASPYIGPIATNDPEIDGMIARLGGVIPPAALLMPISLRNRVVAVVIGHRGAEALSAADVAELLPLAGVAADALSRLIMKAKSVGYRSVDGAAVATPAEPMPMPVDDLPTKKIDRTGGGWSPASEAAPARTPDFGAEDRPGVVSMDADDPESIGHVLDVAEGNDEDASTEAISEAVRRADEALEALRDRFPGKLRVDRYELGGRILRAAEHGPLLAMVIEIGAAAADLLIELMRDSRRDIRYYATLCASELRPRSALGPLVERLFDGDYGVRSVAVDGLRGYPARELDGALESARHALHSEDAKRVQAAADALADLADIRSISDLLDAIQRNDDGSPYARRALVALTKQTHTSARKWRGWWNKAKKQHRIEWLIEGLGHKDEAIRSSSAEDLRKITGEYFGYHHDLPKKEREQARQRWVQWWTETGRRRFVRDGSADERHRPTAVLPVRRD